VAERTPQVRRRARGLERFGLGLDPLDPEQSPRPPHRTHARTPAPPAAPDSIRSHSVRRRCHTNAKGRDASLTVRTRSLMVEPRDLGRASDPRLALGCTATDAPRPCTSIPTMWRKDVVLVDGGAEAAWEAFLDGYATRRAISAWERALIPAFGVLRDAWVTAIVGAYPRAYSRESAWLDDPEYWDGHVEIMRRIERASA
jgi:hypothetical protein